LLPGTSPVSARRVRVLRARIACRYAAAVSTTRSAPADLGLVAQVGRFVAVGVVCALVDFGVYHGLLALGTWIHLAKAISFICGTTAAYVLNRRFTFATEGGRRRLAGFMLLYGTTFALNVGMNALALAVLPEMPLRISVAWVLAQGTATVINFVMLRTVVFRG
jgi:putative flippase GtrA